MEVRQPENLESDSRFFPPRSKLAYDGDTQIARLEFDRIWDRAIILLQPDGSGYASVAEYRRDWRKERKKTLGHRRFAMKLLAEIENASVLLDFISSLCGAEAIVGASLYVLQEFEEKYSVTDAFGGTMDLESEIVVDIVGKSSVFLETDGLDDTGDTLRFGPIELVNTWADEVAVYESKLDRMEMRVNNLKREADEAEYHIQIVNAVLETFRKPNPADIRRSSENDPDPELDQFIDEAQNIIKTGKYKSRSAVNIKVDQNLRWTEDKAKRLAIKCGAYRPKHLKGSGGIPQRSQREEFDHYRRRIASKVKASRARLDV